jgi:hypothetical protein
MPGVEARRRRPVYKVYRRLRDAETFARNQLDVAEVDYGGRLDIANLANHALWVAHGRELPMPRAIWVRPFVEEGDSPDELAYYQPGIGDSPGEITINSGHQAWDDIATTMRLARQENELSTGEPCHPVAHELGELAMHRSIGGERFFPFGEGYLADERTFRALGETGELDEIADTVSDRAIENHSEFVAETFAALLLGRDELRDNETVMQAFERFGGEGILRWIG